MFILAQAGTKLYKLGRYGSMQELTLPDGITIDDRVPPRFAIFNRIVCMVNSPNRPICIDVSGKVWPMTPARPGEKCTLASAAGGAYTGTVRAKYTHVIFSPEGNILAESDYSPISNSAAIVAADIRASNLQLSTDTISARRLYRTTTNGAVYFGWIDLDGNVFDSIQDDMPDAALQNIAAPTLGTVPDLMNIAAYRGRLWGVPRLAGDDLLYSEAGTTYAWPADNLIPIPGGGLSSRGVVSLLARREALGVGRANYLCQITGTEPENFRPITIHDVIGIVSHESLAIWNDTAIFLSDDGVYGWSGNGLNCLTDGDQKHGKVRAWFTSGDFFNRGLFARAFGMVNRNRKSYQLFLCGAGFPYITHWVEMDLRTSRWYGPHKTSAFEPNCGMVVSDDNELYAPLIGGADGFVWREHRNGAYDDVSTGIEFDVEGKLHDDGDPDVDHFFGDVSVIGKVQSAGTMTVTPATGYLDDVTDQAAMSYDMTAGRQRLGIIGVAKTARLRFEHSTADEPVELYGYKIPTHIIGRR